MISVGSLLTPKKVLLSLAKQVGRSTDILNLNIECRPTDRVHGFHLADIILSVAAQGDTEPQGTQVPRNKQQAHNRHC